MKQKLWDIVHTQLVCNATDGKQPISVVTWSPLSSQLNAVKNPSMLCNVLGQKSFIASKFTCIFLWPYWTWRKPMALLTVQFGQRNCSTCGWKKLSWRERAWWVLSQNVDSLLRSCNPAHCNSILLNAKLILIPILIYVINITNHQQLSRSPWQLPLKVVEYTSRIWWEDDNQV